MTCTDRFIAPGTKVSLGSLDDPQHEVGIVVCCWFEPEIGLHDCYIAFFGDSFPTGAPKEQPYVLRYAAVNLTVLEE